MFWWRVGEFFKTVFCAIGKAIAFPFVMLWRFLVWFFSEGHYIPMIPAAVMGLYVLGWATGFFQSWEWEIKPLWDYIHYNYNVTTWSVDWMTNFDHNFLTAITIGLFQIALIIVAAIFETIFVYVIFFGVGTLIWVILMLLFYALILFGIPLLALGFAIWCVARYDTSAPWWRWVCLLLTIGGVVIHCSIIFPAFKNGF